jgi:hypothetical protein
VTVGPEAIRVPRLTGANRLRLRPRIRFWFWFEVRIWARTWFGVRIWVWFRTGIWTRFRLWLWCDSLAWLHLFFRLNLIVIIEVVVRVILVFGLRVFRIVLIGAGLEHAGDVVVASAGIGNCCSAIGSDIGAGCIRDRAAVYLGSAGRVAGSNGVANVAAAVDAAHLDRAAIGAGIGNAAVPRRGPVFLCR